MVERVVDEGYTGFFEMSKQPGSGYVRGGWDGLRGTHTSSIMPRLEMKLCIVIVLVLFFHAGLNMFHPTVNQAKWCCDPPNSPGQGSSN